MNYIREINGFYSWLETHRLPAAAISLWHALMHIANRARWPGEIAVPLSILEAKTGLKRDAIYSARRVLESAGRILVYPRPGRQSAVYCIVPFASDIPTQPQNIVSDIATLNSRCVGNVDATPGFVSEIPIIYKHTNKNLNSVKEEGKHVQEGNQKPDDGFAQFWKAYPKRRDKGGAEKEWQALNPDSILLARMLVALETAKKSNEWTKDGGQFIPHAAKWIRSKGWEDEYTSSQQSEGVQAAIQRMYGRGPQR